MLGAVAMNLLLTFGTLLVVMVVGVVATYPEVSTWPLIGLTAAVALIVGLGGAASPYISRRHRGLRVWDTLADSSNANQADRCLRLAQVLDLADHLPQSTRFLVCIACWTSMAYRTHLVELLPWPFMSANPERRAV